MPTIEAIYANNEGLFQIIALVIGVLVGYISIIQPIVGLTRSQNRINKEQRFKTYHELIDHFTGANGLIMLDRQIAVVFELRRFKEYHPVTRRILMDWKNIYLNPLNPANRFNPENPNYMTNTAIDSLIEIRNQNRLIAEIDKTIVFIDNCWLKKKFMYE